MTDKTDSAPVPVRFEIFYSDGTIARGSTTDEFERAASGGVQFVVVEFSDLSVVKYKGLDVYEYKGKTKPGAWTDRENYDRIKASLSDRSELLVNRTADPRFPTRRRPRA